MNHVNAIRCNDEYQCSHCGKSWDIHDEAPDCKLTVIDVTLFKTVIYFGLSLTVPANFNILTTDSDGVVHAWDCEPFIEGGWWCEYEHAPIHIATVKLHGLNWRETLRKC